MPWLVVSYVRIDGQFRPTQQSSENSRGVNRLRTPPLAVVSTSPGRPPELKTHTCSHRNARQPEDLNSARRAASRHGGPVGAGLRYPTHAPATRPCGGGGGRAPFPEKSSKNVTNGGGRCSSLRARPDRGRAQKGNVMNSADNRENNPERNRKVSVADKQIPAGTPPAGTSRRASTQRFAVGAPRPASPGRVAGGGQSARTQRPGVGEHPTFPVYGPGEHPQQHRPSSAYADQPPSAPRRSRTAPPQPSAPPGASRQMWAALAPTEKEDEQKLSLIEKADAARRTR
jgi:hypothetical protein